MRYQMRQTAAHGHMAGFMRKEPSGAMTIHQRQSVAGAHAMADTPGVPGQKESRMTGSARSRVRK